MPPLSLVVLGAGHVAWHLAPALAAAGHHVAAVWSRTPGSALSLAARLPPTTVLSSPAQAADLHPDLVLLAVPDAAVAPVLAQARLPATLAVAHTAGALPLPPHPRAGVFYPLQSFSRERALDLADVPFCLEASDDATADLLRRLATSVSRRAPYWLTSAERAPLHLAAVFAANFPNHLLGVSHRILQHAPSPLPLDILQPLVLEVVAKAFAAPAGPFSVQTGPAARHDAPTLSAHRARLAANPALAPWLPVYEALTTAIQQATPSPASNPLPAR